MPKVKLRVLKKIKFVFIVSFAIILTLVFARYVSELLFEGKNSYKVYSALKEQKEYLDFTIKQIQFDNARLQKEYFELKNLEPENN